MPILKQIVIFNFKSFRGRITIGPFDPFTAVVGENGVGKSNLMDAISFAMGEKTSNLRVTKLNELIYGASIGKPIAHSAHVTVVFELEDATDISFTRVINGNACEYKIDDQVVTARSYAIKLSELGCNAKAKNFLMFQGTVESIALPKERTRIFEEISNSSELKTDYDRLREELTKAEEEVIFVNKRKRDVMAKKKYALLEVQEADMYRSLQDQYRTLKIELQLFELFHIKKDMEELVTERDQKQQKVIEYEDDKKIANSLLKKKKTELEMLNGQLEKAEQDLSEAENKIKEKEANSVSVKEEVRHWKSKLISANNSLLKAQKSNEVHLRTIQELQDEMFQVEEMIRALEQSMQTQLLSQGSTVEISNSQVQQYFLLKKDAQQQSLEYTQQSNCLKDQQATDQNNLDNENRKKAELENKLKQKEFMMDEIEKGLKKQIDYIDKTEEILTELRKERSNLEEKIGECRNRNCEEMQHEYEIVCKDLSDAKIDNNMFSRMKKKAETLKLLQGLFPEVHGRLHDLCKPIHSRYSTAVTKVLGKYMDAIIVATTKAAIQCMRYLKEQKIDVETFLPLDGLKVHSVQTRLRDIKDPQNVKLVYDVLQFSPREIDVILFVTNNTLVCDTAEDARTVAYEMDQRHRYDCIALDGTFCRKTGIISGGQIELSRRAKMWQDGQLSELEEKREQLKKELIQIAKIPEIESKLNVIDIEIQGLTTRLKYSKYSMADKEKQIVELRKESELIQKELELIRNNTMSIKIRMEERNKEIQDIEKSINEVEDIVFENFCRTIGIANIRQYESRDLRIHQKQTKRKLDLEDQHNRIENLLNFEMERDTQSAILEFEKIIRNCEKKLEAASQKEISSTLDIEKMRENLEHLQVQHRRIKTDNIELKKSVTEYRSQLQKISASILDAQREYNVVITNMGRKNAELHGVVKSCKMEEIPIPLFDGLGNRTFSTLLNTSTDQSTSSFDGDNNPDILFQIDFSKLPESLQRRRDEDIFNSRNKLLKEVTEIQSAMSAVQNPNLKAEEKLYLATNELKRMNGEYQEACKKANKIKGLFEKVKQERYNRFTTCFEHVVDELDVTYKCLAKDDSAQAMLILDNPEEPYLGGISYSFIAPGKGFRPLSNLSGGEKTLVSLALLFAIHDYRPAPFFVLDEVDAALDNVNVKKLVDFIQSKSQMMQFIIISLNKKLFSSADSLIGISSDPDGQCPESLVFTLPLSRYRK